MWEKEKLAKVSTLDTGQMTVPLNRARELGKGPGLGRRGHEFNILDIAMNYGDLLL